jgi:hypothetical protein
MISYVKPRNPALPYSLAAMSLDRLKRSFGEAPGMVCLP